jgi:putative tryptophan/tyrosine transport system substrate-binding protein
MDRRRFLLTSLASALARPLNAGAQQVGKPVRIGWLTSSVIHTRNVDAFKEGMRSLGYRDIAIEFRAAEGKFDRLPVLAAELLPLGLDVIVTDGGPALLAAGQATAMVPIVIGAAATDLVKAGLVKSLARPGGNITGLVISTGPALYGKRLELLREAIPRLARLAVVWDPRNEASRTSVATVENAAKGVGVQVEAIRAPDVQDLEAALAGATRRRSDAMLTIADAFLWSQRERIASSAALHRLPSMFPEAEFVEAGGLMAYGPNVPDNFRRAARYVDKILKGAKPADLPIEEPRKYDFVINLKTAKALGVTILPSLMARADQVIE